MYKSEAIKIIDLLPAKVDPQLREPDFNDGHEHNWYIQVKIGRRTFLVKGHGRPTSLNLVEIELGENKIGFHVLGTKLDLIELTAMLD